MGPASGLAMIGIPLRDTCAVWPPKNALTSEFRPSTSVTDRPAPDSPGRPDDALFRKRFPGHRYLGAIEPELADHGDLHGQHAHRVPDERGETGPHGGRSEIVE